MRYITLQQEQREKGISPRRKSIKEAAESPKIEKMASWKKSTFSPSNRVMIHMSVVQEKKEQDSFGAVDKDS